MQIFRPRTRRMPKKIWNVREPRQTKHDENDNFDDRELRFATYEQEDGSSFSNNENHLPPKKRSRVISALNRRQALGNITNRQPKGNVENQASFPAGLSKNDTKNTNNQMDCQNTSQNISQNLSNLSEIPFNSNGRDNDSLENVSLASGVSSGPFEFSSRGEVFGQLSGRLYENNEKNISMITRSRSRPDCGDSFPSVVFGPSPDHASGIVEAQDEQSNVSIDLKCVFLYKL